MKTFLTQLLFIILAVAIITTGVLIVKSATPSGNLKVNPILGHDLGCEAIARLATGILGKPCSPQANGFPLKNSPAQLKSFLAALAAHKSKCNCCEYDNL